MFGGRGGEILKGIILSLTFLFIHKIDNLGIGSALHEHGDFFGVNGFLFDEYAGHIVENRAVFRQKLNGALVSGSDQAADFVVDFRGGLLGLAVAAAAAVFVFHAHKHGLVGIVGDEAELFAHTPLRDHAAGEIGNFL